MDSVPTLGLGTYVLVLHLDQTETVQIGRLGIFALPAGYYAYVGSAMGSGGLTGRLGHHLKISHRPHWHIDYVRARAGIEQIWYLESPARREHDWAALLGDMPGALIRVPRFGASDCGCASHLFYFPHLPALEEFQERSASHFPGDAIRSALCTNWHCKQD
jgi:Uri superfamily endonuclease